MSQFASSRRERAGHAAASSFAIITGARVGEIVELRVLAGHGP
jgi:hypothetical protein